MCVLFVAYIVFEVGGGIKARGKSQTAKINTHRHKEKEADGWGEGEEKVVVLLHKMKKVNEKNRTQECMWGEGLVRGWGGLMAPRCESCTHTHTVDETVFVCV